MATMTTHRQQLNDEVMDSRDDVGVESSEKSYGAADMSDAPSAEKEQGISQDQGASAGQDNVAVIEKKADVPPNGGYGWVCVAACATINAYVSLRFLLHASSR